MLIRAPLVLALGAIPGAFVGASLGIPLGGALLSSTVSTDGTILLIALAVPVAQLVSSVAIERGTALAKERARR